MEAQFLNPLTDYGFKKLFGEEASRERFTDFLSSLLSEKHQIASLVLRPPEALPEFIRGRKAFFDSYCHAAQSITEGKEVGLVESKEIGLAQGENIRAANLRARLLVKLIASGMSAGEADAMLN